MAHIEEKQKLEINNRRKRLNQEAERKILEVRLQTVREEPEEGKARSESDDEFVDAFLAAESSKVDSVSSHKGQHQTTFPINSIQQGVAQTDNQIPVELQPMVTVTAPREINQETSGLWDVSQVPPGLQSPLV